MRAVDTSERKKAMKERSEEAVSGRTKNERQKLSKCSSIYYVFEKGSISRLFEKVLNRTNESSAIKQGKMTSFTARRWRLTPPPWSTICLDEPKHNTPNFHLNVGNN